MIENDVEMSLIDTHSHCPRLKDDSRKRFIKDLYGERGKSISKIINIAVSYDENIDAEEPGENGCSIFRGRLCDDEGNIYSKLNYFAHGIHPKEVHQVVFSGIHDMSDYEIETLENEIFNKLKDICSDSNNKCVAIGETGFEFYYDEPYKYKDLQRRFYERHIELAHELDLPLIIHHRSSKDDTLGRENANEEGIKLLKENARLLRNNPGVIHCYIGTYEEARIFCEELSFVLGIGAAFLDERNDELREVIKRIPLEWIVLETDTPYIKPKGLNTGYKQNTPLNLPYIANGIAKLKGVSIEEVARITTNNAYRVFDKLNEW